MKMHFRDPSRYKIKESDSNEKKWVKIFSFAYSQGPGGWLPPLPLKVSLSVKYLCFDVFPRSLREKKSKTRNSLRGPFLETVDLSTFVGTFCNLYEIISFSGKNWNQRHVGYFWQPLPRDECVAINCSIQMETRGGGGFSTKTRLGKVLTC